MLTSEQQLTITCDDGTTVTLIDVYGDDTRVSQAARTSYGREKAVRTCEQDFNLLNYLLKNRHSTPFEQCEVTFLLTMPISTARQHIRHRMSSTNEYSTRYATALDCMSAVGDRLWRSQSDSNKQGSSGTVDTWPKGWVFQRAWPAGVKPADVEVWNRYELTPDAHSKLMSVLKDDSLIGTDKAIFCESLGIHSTDDWQLWNLTGPQAVLVCDKLPYMLTPSAYLSMRESDIHAECLLSYEERLEFGVAKEQARNCLPLDNMTRMYWKIDLHNFMHYLGLRRESHAQLEIRQMADAMYELAKPYFPISLAAWEEWQFKGMRFGDCEQTGLGEMLRPVIAAGGEEAYGNATGAYAAAWKAKHGLDATGRQLEEFRAKLEALTLK